MSNLLINTKYSIGEEVYYVVSLDSMGNEVFGKGIIEAVEEKSIDKGNYGYLTPLYTIVDDSSKLRIMRFEEQLRASYNAEFVRKYL